jgi:YVTN family beta-propeller protein
MFREILHHCRHLISFKCRLAVLVIFLIVPGRFDHSTAQGLSLLATIQLPDVSARIDHMAFDPEGNRLFIAAIGNNTVEIIDTKAGTRVATIRGLREPQNVLFIKLFKCIVVSNGGNGSVRFYNSDSFALFHTLDLGDDADNMRYDSAGKQLFVGFGYGGVAVIDAAKGDLLTTMQVPGHPEAFELEPDGERIFVNVPSARQVAVLDRKQHTQVEAWNIEGAHDNYPMALDGKNHRLFIGCRAPAKLVVLNTDTGRETAILGCSGDADDIFYEETGRRIYVTGGAGGIDVFLQMDADRYSHLSRTSTAIGARTSIIAPDNHALYVAVPRLLLRPAQIRSYGIP